MNKIYLAVTPDVVSGNNVTMTGMQKCDEMNILGRPHVSPLFPAPSRNWRSCLPQRLEKQRHARQPCLFCTMPFIRYLQCCHSPETPSVFFVLPLVGLQLTHSTLIVGEERWRYRFLNWLNGTVALLTLFLLFVHFNLSTYVPLQTDCT